MPTSSFPSPPVTRPSLSPLGLSSACISPSHSSSSGASSASASALSSPYPSFSFSSPEPNCPPPTTSYSPIPIVVLSSVPSPTLSARPPRSSSLQNPFAENPRPRASSEPPSMVSLSSLSPEDQASAQHVRKVYAYLDQVGVPGDGFSEGVERTREHRRLSHHPQNMMQQQQAGLSQPELDVLRSADRYGFFKNPGAERLVLLHPRAFFPSTIATPPPQSASVGQQAELEASRISKWTEMLVGDRRDSGSNIISYRLSAEWEAQWDRFVKRCYKGIPDRWRRAAWEMLIKDFGRRTQERGFVSIERLCERYNEAIVVPSDQDVQIDLDVPRTINGHVFFHTRYGRGQRALFQVLHAFGMHCDTCGYCQGMGPIAATLLNYFDAQMAYVCMVRLHDWYTLHEVFAPGFPGLVECFYVQERLIEYLLPDVHKTFGEQMISTSSYATKWYITLFANTVPFEAQLRLWDVLFLDGIDVLILASVAIIYALRAQLGPGNDFEMILSKLGGRFEMGEGAINWIRSIRKLKRRKDVSRILINSRIKWQTFVKDGTASKMVT